MHPLRLVQKADKLLSDGKFAHALSLFTQAQTLRPDPFLRAEANYGMAECFRALGRFREALVAYGRSHTAYRRLRVASERLRTLLGVSACLRILGRYRRARSLWRAVDRAKRFGAVSPSLAEVRLEEALVERGLGRFKAASTRLNSAVAGLKKRRDLGALQHAYWTLGGLERFSGRLGPALKAFQHASRLAVNIGDPSAQAFALCGEGGVLRVLGKGEASFRRYRRAHALHRRLKDSFGQAYGLCGMANALRTFGDARKSLPLYQRSAALYRRLGDQSSEGFALWGLGGSFRCLKKWRDSDAAYRQARALFKKSADSRGLIMTDLGRARLAESRGDFPRAFLDVRRALTLARKVRLPYEIALALWEKGRMRGILPPGRSPLRTFGLSSQSLKRWRDIP